MLIKYGNKKTPATRFKKYLKHVIKTKNYLCLGSIKFLNKKTSKKFRGGSFNRRIFFRKKKIFLKNLSTHINWVSVIKSFLVDLRKRYSLISNKFNILNFIPYISNHFPGLILRTLKTDNYRILGQQVFLRKVPINSTISNIFNILNLKPTFSRSVGTVSFKRKKQKKLKLIQVELPSKEIKLFKNNTVVSYGYFRFFKKKTFYEGKWGFTERNFKKINVRGVAKNPVDHPNGGRTKAKQPEKSPWGWVAKFNK